jgi:hypothetical protein
MVPVEVKGSSLGAGRAYRADGARSPDASGQDLCDAQKS